MQGIRLNTHADSIEPGRVQGEPRLAFQPRIQTMRGGPETLCSQPKGDPFKLKDGSAIKVGVQFFADVPLGRMLQIISFWSYVWPAAAGPIQKLRSAGVPNADRGAQAPI